VTKLISDGIARAPRAGLTARQFARLHTAYSSDTDSVKDRLTAACQRGLNRDPAVPNNLSNAMDEVLREARSITTEQRSAGTEAGPKDAALSNHEHDIIGQYSVVMEKRQAPISRESELPAPRAQIRAALLKAQLAPIYRLGGNAVDIGLKVLDTFVPDADYEDTQTLLARVRDAAKNDDADSYGCLLTQAPEHQRRAVMAALDVATNATIERSRRPGRI